MSRVMSRRSRSRLLLLALMVIVTAVTGAKPRVALAQWVILHGKNGHTEQGIPAETVKTLKDLAKKGAQFSSIAFTPNGGWIILHDKYAIFARNAPQDAVRILAEQQDKKVELKSIHFTFAGGFTIFAGNGTQSWDIGPEPFDKLGELAKAGHKVKSIAFAPEGGWIILYDKNSFYAKGLPEHAFDKIVELGKKNADLKSIAFARSGGWAILYNKNSVAFENIPKDAEKALNDLTKKRAQIKSVTFMTGSFLPLSDDTREARDEVLFRMNRADVPGLGIVLVENGKLEWARGYGVLRAGEETPVTDRTRFQAGAISQSVTALAALCLVQQGKLGLDQPLNEVLTSWKVPENEFTRQTAPTLRQVLSHSAGFNVPGFAFNRNAIPTLRDVLEGKAETPAVEVGTRPGSKFAESAGGYCVMQQLLMDITGKPFPELMRELVLEPAGMNDSTFEQPLPKAWEADAAVGHLVDQNPLPWRWHNCTPALAAAGLWTTPADLARFIVALSDATHGKPKAILSEPLASAMLTRQVDDGGLGLMLSGSDRGLTFMHQGANPGYTCRLIACPATGQGAVIMTNSDSGERLINELTENLKTEYGWP
jgi:CubicO group peptidase (beta-lactamase class C family)